MKKVKLPRLLSNDMKERATLHPSEANITFNQNAPHTANLYLPPDAPEVNMHDWVHLYTADGDAGIFRVINPGNDVGNELRLVLRHGICVMADDVVKMGEEEISGTLGELLTRFWSATGVSKTPQFWRLGSIASTPVIKYQPSGHTLLQAVQTILKKARNYALEYDQSVFPWVLNVVKLTDENPCEGRFTRNLDSVNIDVEDSELCTRVYLDDRDGHWDADTIDQWGPVSKILNVPENATDESISAYVADYLETHKNPTVTIECSGADMSQITGESIDKLTLGRMCRACLPSYGITVNERIVSVNVPDVYGDPHGKRLYMNNKAEAMSDLLVMVERDTSDLQSTAVKAARRAGGMQKEIEKSYAELVVTAQELVRIENETVVRFNEVGIILDANEVTLNQYAVQLNEHGNLISGAFLRLDGAEAEIEARVEKDGVISAINLSPEAVVISSGRINLEGYVTAYKLSTEFASLRETYAFELSTQNLYANSGYFANIQFENKWMYTGTAKFATGVSYERPSISTKYFNLRTASGGETGGLYWAAASGSSNIFASNGYARAVYDADERTFVMVDT